MSKNDVFLHKTFSIWESGFSQAVSCISFITDTKQRQYVANSLNFRQSFLTFTYSSIGKYAVNYQRHQCRNKWLRSGCLSQIYHSICKATIQQVYISCCFGLLSSEFGSMSSLFTSGYYFWRLQGHRLPNLK